MSRSTPLAPSKPLTILSAARAADTAGVSIGIKQAFDQYAPDWTFHSVMRHTNYIGYPMDLPWDEDTIGELWYAADVVHLHNSFEVAEYLKSYGKRPEVIHYHGGLFRAEPWVYLTEQRQRGAIGLVSTLDLYLLDTEYLEWLPTPVDIERMQAIRAEHYQPGPIRIGHAPTDRTIKSTRAFQRAVYRLQSELGVEMVLIEHRPWQDCLRFKATVDIFFDQVKLGYGVNALEAWAMGIPVVAGAQDDTLDEMESRFELPFYHATEATIYDALRELVVDEELRREYGEIGYRYVNQWHHPKAVVERMKAIYSRAVA